MRVIISTIDTWFLFVTIVLCCAETVCKEAPCRQNVKKNKQTNKLKDEKKEESTCHRLILCTEQDGGDGLCILCEYLCDGTDGPLPPSLNFEPCELDCHCTPLLVVFFGVTMRTLASFYLSCGQSHSSCSIF